MRRIAERFLQYTTGRSLSMTLVTVLVAYSCDPPRTDVTPPPRDDQPQDQPGVSGSANGDAEAAPSFASSNILGSDGNDDGIRDDVRSELERQYQGKRAKMAAVIRFALATQHQLALVAKDQTPSPKAIEKLSTDAALASFCGWREFGEKWPEISDEILALTLNSEERIMAYVYADLHFPADVVAVPSEEILAKSCR